MYKKLQIALFGALILLGTDLYGQTALEIIEKVDENMIARSTITESEMVVYGRRSKRKMLVKNYADGYKKSFSEYLAPAREKGTKMLKLDNQLWIYSPSTDRTIKLSGHMLRQSVMGSDLSYEDMMEDRELRDMYETEIIGEEDLEGRPTWLLELNAKVEDVSYTKRRLWVDQEKFVPLKEELFAKSGKLLKRVVLSEVKQIEGRWYPTKINFKDMLKKGKGTDYVVKEISFDPKIASHIFSKASLRK